MADPHELDSNEPGADDPLEHMRKMIRTAYTVVQTGRTDSLSLAEIAPQLLYGPSVIPVRTTQVLTEALSAKEGKVAIYTSLEEQIRRLAEEFGVELPKEPDQPPR